MSIEFIGWPKTSRLFREIVVTEKIDGTNSAIHIQSATYEDYIGSSKNKFIEVNDDIYEVAAQSRKRLIYPGDDNFGFAGWVHDNAAELVQLLGPGIHYGEWWGKGIQRNYGLDERRFSLFNTDKWCNLHTTVGGHLINTVPHLYEGTFDQAEIESALVDLQQDGSYAAPGFMKPEGICVFHSQSRKVYKVTLDGGDFHKWQS